tara:strand:+ start:105 stop:311 length:207 start_codon:yes stop_codon:yes gene_type:complete
VISLKSVKIETVGVCTWVLLKNAFLNWMQRYSLIGFYQEAKYVNLQTNGYRRIIVERSGISKDYMMNL